MTLKTIYATEHGSFIRHQPTSVFGSWDLLSQKTREHDQMEAGKHAATIQAMRDDRALGLGRMYGPDCYAGSPGWWRSHVRKMIRLTKQADPSAVY